MQVKFKQKERATLSDGPQVSRPVRVGAYELSPSTPK